MRGIWTAASPTTEEFRVIWSLTSVVPPFATWFVLSLVTYLPVRFGLS